MTDSPPSNIIRQPDSLKNDLAWSLICIAAIILGLILRVTLRTSSSLWEDEIIAATHAVQPWLQVIIHSFWNDMHPPLYFLELHYWSRLGCSDVWLIANSILFSIAAIVSIYLVVRRLSDARRALIVTAVFSLLPVTLWMAEEVRMYAMLSVLLIWLYYFTQKAFAPPQGSATSRVAVILLSIAIIYTHAIGFIAVFFYGIYATGQMVTRRAVRRDWLIWLAVFGASGIAAVPMIFIDLVVSKADMTPIHGLGGIISWMASIVAGKGYESFPWLRMAGLATYLAVIVAGTIVTRTRQVTLCFLIAPLLLCAIAEIASRPLFKTNFFPNLCSPFLALVIGEILISMPVRKTVRAIIFICILAELLTMAIANRIVLNQSDAYFRQAADVIVEQKQPGDVVWAPQGDIFWGMAWYLIGPDWGSPLAINEPIPPQSRRWKLFDFLGPALVKRLDLIPTSQSIISKDGLPILTATTSQPIAEQSKRLWLVTYPRSDVPAGVGGNTLGQLRRSESFRFPPLEVNLYEQQPGK